MTRDCSVDFVPPLDEEAFQRAGVEVLAKSEAEFPVDFEEGIDDRRSNLAVQQRRIASHARILDDRGERCGILSMQCRSFRCPTVRVLRPSPFLKNVSGRPGAPKPMGVSADSQSSSENQLFTPNFFSRLLSKSATRIPEDPKFLWCRPAP
jgi:hypothetical protein